MKIGYFLSCEEYPPASLIEQAKLAEQAGFESLWISGRDATCAEGFFDFYGSPVLPRLRALA